MTTPAPGTALSPVSVRAVCLGLYASIFIALLSAYNDCYLNNTYFIGNHFPVASIVFVAFLVLAVNTAARKYFGVNGLRSGELLLIWGMVGLAGSLSSYSFVGYFPSFVAAPAYYATKGNEYGAYILQHLPDWLVVSRDPEDPALSWFMEGMPAGESIPWGKWVGPIVAWCGFAILLYATNFAVCSVFFQQWSKRERLIFPIVQVPAELAKEAPQGQLLNDFLNNRLTWIGIAIPCIVWGARGLNAYVPELPDVRLSWGTWGFFPDRPWSAFHLNNAETFFSVIGLSFLLTREVGFSFWFFYVLYRLSFVLGAWLGAGGKGFFGDWGARVSVFETGGAMLAMVVFLLWTARHSLFGWFGRALSFKRDEEQDPIPPTLAFGIISLGLFAMMGWYVLAGAQWWVGVVAVLVFLAMLLVLTRVVAESGLLFLSGIAEPFKFVTGLFPMAWLSGASVTTLALQRGINTEDMRKVFMPYIMSALKAGEMGRLKLGQVTAVLAVAAFIGLGVGTYSFIATSYKYGAVNVEWWASVMAPKYYLDDAAKRQKDPPDYDTLKVGGKSVLPVNVAHLLVGAALVGGMLVLRAQFPWWPLHPFGFTMCATWAVQRIWFSILLGWLAKFGVMSFGGAKVYRMVLPLFLGMAVGECVISVFWMIIGLITGVPNEPLVP